MKSPAHVRSRGFSASVAVLAAPLSGVPRAFGGQLTTSLAGRVGEAAKVVRAQRLLVSLGRSGVSRGCSWICGHRPGPDWMPPAGLSFIFYFEIHQARVF